MSPSSVRQETGQNFVAQVLLTLHECVSLIISFQDGVPGIIRSRMMEQYQTICAMNKDKMRLVHILPPSFRHLEFCKHERVIDTSALYLHEECIDSRFALHVAIVEGELDMVRRIVNMDEKLLTLDAYKVALRFCRVGILGELENIFRKWYGSAVDDAIKQFLQEENGVSIQSLEYLHNIGFDLHDYVREILVGCCDASNLDYLYQHGFGLTIPEMSDIIIFATKNGHHQWLEQILPSLTQLHTHCEAARWAGRGGNLEIIQAFAAHGNHETIASMMSGAIECELIDVMEWLEEHHAPTKCLQHWKGALKEERVKIVQWFVRRFPHEIQKSDLYLTEPFYVKNIEIVRTLREMGQPLEHVLPASVEVAEFLFENGVEMTAFKFFAAIGAPECHPSATLNDLRATQSLDTARFILERCKESIEIDSTAVDNANHFGTCEILQLLHEAQPQQYDSFVLKNAIQRGFLEQVKFLHEIVGMPWEPTSLMDAVQHSHKEVVAYILQHSDKSSWRLNHCLMRLCSLDFIDFVQDEIPQRSDQCLMYYARFGHLDRVQSLLSHPELKFTPFYLRCAVREAVEGGQPLVFRELCTRGGPLWDKMLPPENVISVVASEVKTQKEQFPRIVSFEKCLCLLFEVVITKNS